MTRDSSRLDQVRETVLHHLALSRAIGSDSAVLRSDVVATIMSRLPGTEAIQVRDALYALERERTVESPAVPEHKVFITELGIRHWRAWVQPHAGPSVDGDG